MVISVAAGVRVVRFETNLGKTMLARLHTATWKDRKRWKDNEKRVSVVWCDFFDDRFNIGYMVFGGCLGVGYLVCPTSSILVYSTISVHRLLHLMVPKCCWFDLLLQASL